MKLGHDRSLFLIAFDHRSSFSRGLFGATEPLSPELRAAITDVKELIFESFKLAIMRGAPRKTCGILVDERFGAGVARKAKAGGFALAMPVEKSGQAEFQFEYGDDFGRHIEDFDPDFSKVLVRYNPEGDRELNLRQTERLALLSAWLHERQRRFLFELLVPPTPAQLARAGGKPLRYDRELRAELVVQALRELQDGGVEPDIWKIEGLESSIDCAKVVQQARTGGGRERVVCVVLGRGASLERVQGWIANAAPVPGFDGFAVGRTLWREALEGYVRRALTREQARIEIAGRYLRLVRAYTEAARPARAEQER
jgi:myo-inositol catabolism protein IolC